MPLIKLNAAAVRIGIKRALLDTIIKNGKELNGQKVGARYFVDEAELDAWIAKKRRRTFELTRDDFLKAFKFALRINYGGHTRSDFGSSRQRSTTQSVENWTQGMMAELALSKFLKDRYNIEIRLDFTVRNVVVGQDITEVIRARVANPPRVRISVKSGKENGMILIVPEPEVESPQRVSDYYVFVRVLYPNDFILRLLREHADLSDLQSIIPAFQLFKAEIVGYCAKADLEHRAVPEAQIPDLKYVKATGLLKSTDADWQAFADML